MKESLYCQTPDHYDAMMGTELEKLIFEKVVQEIKDNLKTRKTFILDLCCGTGILAEMLRDIKNIEFTGVDQNDSFLSSAKEKIKNNPRFKWVLSDVLTYEPNSKYDLVILTSAYHHIKNQFKSQLLLKIFNFLKDDGCLIIYEKLISPYKNQKEFCKSNEEFYQKRIEFLKKTESQKLSQKQLNALMNVCTLSSSAEEEYKVDYNYLLNDLKQTGFKIVKEIKLWPKENLFNNGKVGDFIFVVGK